MKKEQRAMPQRVMTKSWLLNAFFSFCKVPYAWKPFSGGEHIFSIHGMPSQLHQHTLDTHLGFYSLVFIKVWLCVVMCLGIRNSILEVHEAATGRFS